MSDLERLEAWMMARDATMKSLAREMDMKYITLYHMMRRKRVVNDPFIVRFVRHFGCDEALRIFTDHLTLA